MKDLINLEEFSDKELLEVVAESQKKEWDESSIIRRLAIQYYNDDDLINILHIKGEILQIVAQRMKKYSELYDLIYKWEDKYKM